MVVLALLGIAFLQLLNQYLYPLIEEGLGVEQDLQRFAEVAGNVPAAIAHGGNNTIGILLLYQA